MLLFFQDSPQKRAFVIMERNIFPEKLVNYTDIVRGAGHAALNTLIRFVRHINTEPRLAHSDHYHPPVPQTPEQLQFPDPNQVVPDIKGMDLPPFDSEGTYLARD